MKYGDLSPEWRKCFGLARDAYRNASLPIGCLIIDAQGWDIASARAAMVYGSVASNMTQHAEIEALAKIPVPLLEQRLIAYCTTEPCPMCFGALNVARVAELHFATRDPWAGSTDLLDGNWYMQRKHIELKRGPEGFERIMAAWLVHAMMRKRDGTFCDADVEFVQRWRIVVPDLDSVLHRLRNLDPGYSIRDEQFFEDLAERVGQPNE